jgi:uncharacterized protein DUF2784
MVFAVLAFVTVLFHLAFILFVIFGGLLVARRPRLAPVHLACAAWGAYVALANRICPLTPLENWFRQRGGGSAYAGDFLEHYLLAIVYPTGLTAGTQRALGVAVIILNAGVYAWILRTRRGRMPASTVTPPEP